MLVDCSRRKCRVTPPGRAGDHPSNENLSLAAPGAVVGWAIAGLARNFQRVAYLCSSICLGGDLSA
eukprot:5300062-Pyramimonas_sp.AAC.1